MRSSSLATCLALGAAAGLGAAGPVFAQTMEWDATSGNGVVDGGGGIWDASSTTWTKNNGNSNVDWEPGSVARFSGAGGLVSVTGVQVIDGLVFTGDNYTIGAANAASALELDDSSANLTVGAANTATISAAITGLGGVVVNGPGTLILSGANTYAGATTVTGGSALRNEGQIAGAVAVDSGTLNNSGAIAGLVTNKGLLVSTGALNGGLTNSGNSTADIRGAAAGPIINQGNSALTISGDLDVGGNILTNRNSATVVVEAGATTGITTLTNTSNATIGVDILAGASLTADRINNGDDATIVNRGALTANNLISNAAGGTIINQGNLTAANGILNGGTLNNSDNGIINADITNSGTLQNASNGGVINGNIDNAGIVVSGGVINGDVTNTNDFLSSGTINGSLTNSGAASARLSGAVNGPVLNEDAGALRILGSLGLGNNTLTNTGAATLVVEAGATTGITALTNSSSADDGITVMSGAVLTANTVGNGAGAEIVNLGTLNAAGGIQNDGTLNNSDNAIINGDVTNSGTGLLLNASNGGLINGAIFNTGELISGGTINGNLTNGSLTGSGIASISGITKGAILNQNSSSLSIVGSLDASGQALTNTGTSTVLVQAGATTGITTLTNSSTAAIYGFSIGPGASLTAENVNNMSGSGILNLGILQATNAFQNNGLLESTGTMVGALRNSGFFSSFGMLDGSLTNTGYTRMSGVMNGAILNQADGELDFDGTLDARNSALTNTGTATFKVVNGVTTGISTLTNSSTADLGVVIEIGSDLTASNVINGTGATIVNIGTLSATAGFDNMGTLTSTGTLNGAMTNGGTVLSSGTVNGDVDNTGAFTSTGTLNGSLTNGSLTAAAGASVSGVINGPILNQSSSLLNVIGSLDMTNNTVTNTGIAKFAVTTGATTGISSLINSSLGIDGVSVASGASLTAGDVRNEIGASILNNGTINGAVSSFGGVTNNGKINGTLMLGDGTLSGTGNLSGLNILHGTVLAASEQTIAGDTTQFGGSVLGSIIGPGAGQYLMAGGSISGSVTQYAKFVQTGGDLAAGSQITVDAFGSTGGTDSGAVINARLRAAAAGGTITELAAAESDISNASGGISFLSRSDTTIGSAATTALTTLTTSAGATDIDINGGIAGLRGINAAALGGGAITIDTLGPISTSATAISMRTAGGAGIANIFGNVSVTGADAALAGAGNSVFNIASGVTVSAAKTVDSQSGQTVLNNNGTLDGGTFSSAGGGLTINNLLGGVINMNDGHDSNFGAANDAFNNSGALNVSGDVSFSGLEGFTGEASSAINMINGQKGDSLSLGGADLNLGSSTLNLDVDLSQPGNTGLNDQILLVGDLSGNGAVINLNDTSGTVPVIGFVGPTLISAQSITPGSTFAVTGLSDAGFFEYSLVQNGGNLDLSSKLREDVAGGIVSNFITAQNTVSNAFFKPSSSFVSTPVNPDENQFGFAPWFRTSGGLSNDASQGVAMLPSGALQNVESKVKIGYGGYQFGLDGGLFNIGDTGANLHLGLTGGQIFGTASQVDFNNKTSMVDTFVGGYAVFSKGPFFVDAMLRQEFIDYSVNVDDLLFKITDAKVESQRFSAGASAGYSFKLNDWSLVPAAGYTYARTRTGDLVIAGASGSQSPVVASFADGTSHLTFAGVSVARSYLLFDDRVRLSPFVSATLYHDFGKENEASLVVETANGPQVFDVSSKTGPTYGEVSLGANFLALTPEFGGSERLLTGNVRGDVQFGKDRLAGSLNLQVRLQF